MNLFLKKKKRMHLLCILFKEHLMKIFDAFDTLNTLNMPVEILLIDLIESRMHLFGY